MILIVIPLIQISHLKNGTVFLCQCCQYLRISRPLILCAAAVILCSNHILSLVTSFKSLSKLDRLS